MFTKYGVSHADINLIILTFGNKNNPPNREMEREKKDVTKTYDAVG